MKKKIKIQKKNLLIIGIALLVVIILIIVLVNILKKKPENEISNKNSVEEFVRSSENGEKTNISSKIKETKKVEGLEFSDIKVSMKNNETLVTGKVKNPTKDSINGFYFKVTALNTSNEAIAESEGLLDSIIPAGSSSSFEITTSKDFANCYDIKIEKIKDAD